MIGNDEELIKRLRWLVYRYGAVEPLSSQEVFDIATEAMDRLCRLRAWNLDLLAACQASLGWMKYHDDGSSEDRKKEVACKILEAALQPDMTDVASHVLDMIRGIVASREALGAEHSYEHAQQVIVQLDRLIERTGGDPDGRRRV